jgi:hypothetical protein
LIGVHLHHAENVPVVLVAAVAATVSASETVTEARRTEGRKTATASETVIVTGMIAIVGIGEIAEKGTVTIEIRRRTTIVAAGVPTASAVCRPPSSRKMTSLGLRLQSERVKVLACLLSVWIRAKMASLLVLSRSLPCSSILVLSHKMSDVCSVALLDL